MVLLHSHVQILGRITSKAVQLAINDLQRDLKKVISDSDVSDFSLRLEKDSNLPRQTFSIKAERNGLSMCAPDELGFVYGIYHISRELLGIPDFWFWMDWKAKQHNYVELPDNYQYTSGPFLVKNRGWFINDEVLLMEWSIENDRLQPWRMVFETLLRCNGNMVIPGTGSDVNKHIPLARERGLVILSLIHI